MARGSTDNRESGLDGLLDAYASNRVSRREFLDRAVALGFALPAAAALLAACGGASSAPPAATSAGTPTEGTVATTATTTSGATSKTLKIRTSGVTNLDEANLISVADWEVALDLGEGLVSYKPGTWELVHTLAESLESSSDGLRHTFVLKQGIPFHGGYGEVTADDVKYSYERIAGLTTPKVTAVYQTDWAPLERVDVTGKYSGTIVLKTPFAALMTATMPLMSGHVLSKKAIEDRGKKYETHPIGTGPYEVAEFAPQTHVVLRRFSDYGGGNSAYADPVEWNEIVLTEIGDDNAAENALAAGDIDAGQLPLTAVSRFEQNSDFNLEKRTTLDYHWLTMNVQHPKLSDINVRQAIRYAVDVPSILDAAFDGRATPAYALLSPAMPVGFWPDAPHYARDLDKAKTYLQRAGVTDLELSLAYWSEFTPHSTAAEIIQANLKDIGITVNIEALETAAIGNVGFGEKALRTEELTFVVYDSTPDPSAATVWFTCDQVKQYNINQWCDKRYDDLHLRALQELDETKRSQMYIVMQQLMDEASHSVWAAHSNRYFVARSSIKQSMLPTGVLLHWNFRSA